MLSRKTLLGVATSAALAGAAFAGSVAPTAVVFDEGAVEASLTGAAGDAANGKAVFANRKLGNCLACHVNADLASEGFHGEVGPPLDGAADRWSEAELRGIVINAKEFFGDQTIMPAFYRTTGFNRTLDKFDGKTILEAQEVEDLVAYLLTLKE